MGIVACGTPQESPDTQRVTWKTLWAISLHVSSGSPHYNKNAPRNMYTQKISLIPICIQSHQNLRVEYETLSENYDKLHHKSQEIIRTLQTERDGKIMECEELKAQVSREMPILMGVHSLIPRLISPVFYHLQYEKRYKTGKIGLGMRGCGVHSSGVNHSVLNSFLNGGFFFQTG